MSYKYPDSPKVAVGAVVFKNNKILLVKRGHPPAQFEWTIPGGKVKLGETLKTAAEREIYEETNICIKAKRPVFTFDMIEKDNKDNIMFHYVIIDFDAKYVKGQIKAGDDALDAMWVSEEKMQKLNINFMTKKILKDQYNFG